MTKEGVKAKYLLKTAGIDFVIVLKEIDSELRLFSNQTSYKGIRGIKAFIGLEKSKTKK